MSHHARYACSTSIYIMFTSLGQVFLIDTRGYIQTQNNLEPRQIKMRGPPFGHPQPPTTACRQPPATARRPLARPPAPEPRGSKKDVEIVDQFLFF